MGLAHVYIELDNFKKVKKCFDKAEKIDVCDFEFLSDKGKYLLFKKMLVKPFVISINV